MKERIRMSAAALLVGLATGSCSTSEDSSADDAASKSMAVTPVDASVPEGSSPEVDLDALDCELSGRWLATTHLTTDAIGALQFGHYYEYYELAQEGDKLTITKGFMCYADAVGDGTLAADVDFSGANAALPSRVRYDGRTGSITKGPDGCRIELEKWYTVRGATTPHYLDPANELPDADQQASGSTPGWEDWDSDGEPGVTGVLTGIISGKIFVAPRLWTTMSGTATDASHFTLGVKWNQEQNVMAFDGSPLLATEAAIAPDPSHHFAEFRRLSEDQASSDDDLDVCAEIIELAPELTPDGAGS